MAVPTVRQEYERLVAPPCGKVRATQIESLEDMSRDERIALFSMSV